MQITSQILSGLATDAGWIILSIDHTQLALPGSDLVSIELSNALKPEVEEDTTIVAWFSHNKQKWPVYCVDGHLALLSMIPTERSFGLFIKYQNQVIGLLCDRVRKLPPEELLLTQKLPLCMYNQQSPIRALAMVDNEPTGIIDAESFSNYLLSQVK